MSLYLASTWQAPAPVPTPVHDALAVDILLIPLSDDAVRRLAAEWLRDIGRAARAKTRDIIWTSTADRDITGAFPVVAVG